MQSREDRPLDRIELKGLVVDCIVGVYPAERTTPQPLHVDIVMHLDTRDAARGGRLRDTVDYARVCGEVRFLLESCRFLLLETAAEALSQYLLAVPTDDAPHAAIEAIELTLTKPAALRGGVVPSLTIYRQRGELPPREIEHKRFGEVDVVYETTGCGIYRLRVAPGHGIPTHIHHEMDESELVLGDGLLLQGKPVAAGTGVHWPRKLPHRYDNPTQLEQTILCVDRPAFIPEDEVECEEPDDGLVLPPMQSYFREW